MEPFLRKSKNSWVVRLHRGLYGKELLVQAKRNEPDSIGAIRNEKDYYLVELPEATESDCFDFLNYLILLKRSN